MHYKKYHVRSPLFAPRKPPAPPAPPRASGETSR